MSVPVTNDHAAGLSDDELDSALVTLQSTRLNPGQWIYVEMRAADVSASKAAKASGYASPSTLQNNEYVVDAIVLERERLSRLANTTREWRRLQLRKVVELGYEQDPPMLSAVTGALKALNEMDAENKLRLTLADGMNQMLATLEINVDTDLVLLGKLQHLMGLGLLDDAVAPAIDGECKTINEKPAPAAPAVPVPNYLK